MYVDVCVCCVDDAGLRRRTMQERVYISTWPSTTPESVILQEPLKPSRFACTAVIQTQSCIFTIDQIFTLYLSTGLCQGGDSGQWRESLSPSRR